MMIGGRGLLGSCMTCGVTCVETIGLEWPPVMFILMLLVYKDASAVNPGICMTVILCLLSAG
jgi:hypothetical protein